MQKRHRRSLQKEMSGGEESAEPPKEKRPGKYTKLGGKKYPDLFNGDDEKETPEIGWKSTLMNKSWPPDTKPTSISSMEEQEEDDDQEVPEEPHTSRRRQAGRMAPDSGRRSLPLEPPRSAGSSRSGSVNKRRGKMQISGPDDESAAVLGILYKFHSNSDQTPNEYKFLFFLVALVIIGIPCIVSIYMAGKQLTPDQQFENFKQDLRKLLHQEMPSSSDNTDKTRRAQAGRILVYVADKMLRRNEPESNGEGREGEAPGPMTLLMASRDWAKVERMARHYADMLQRNWPNYKLLNHSLQSTTTRMDLEKTVLEPILTGSGLQPSMVLLLLDGIHQLHGTSPLFLHSLADPESSPLPGATPHNFLIVGTLKLAVTTDGPKGAADCAELIENSLLQSWQSDALSGDQIHPIISRISAHSVCLDN